MFILEQVWHFWKIGFMYINEYYINCIIFIYNWTFLHVLEIWNNETVKSPSRQKSMLFDLEDMLLVVCKNRLYIFYSHIY